jgi:hypothetical protein
MLKLMPIVPGSYNQVYRKCGKPNCWCQDGESGHPLKRISWTENGVSHSKAVPEQDIQWVIPATNNFRLFRKLYKEFQSVQNEIEETVTKIEWEMIRETRREKKWI